MSGATGKRRWQLLQLLGGAGLGAAALLTLGTWGLTLTLGPAASSGLTQAESALQTLDGYAQSAITTLEPADVLARPETLNALHTLAGLAETLQNSPLAALVPGGDQLAGQLQGVEKMLAAWETALEQRPSLPTLRAQQADVQLWLGRVQAAQRWLWPLLWLLNGAALLLGAWFAAGQWALLKLASERLQQSGARPGMPELGRDD